MPAQWTPQRCETSGHFMKSFLQIQYKSEFKGDLYHYILKAHVEKISPKGDP
jgi:hypothetical protein